MGRRLLSSKCTNRRIHSCGWGWGEHPTDQVQGLGKGALPTQRGLNPLWSCGQIRLQLVNMPVKDQTCIGHGWHLGLGEGEVMIDSEWSYLGLGFLG